jgi:Bacterial Ig domain
MLWKLFGRRELGLRLLFLTLVSLVALGPLCTSALADPPPSVTLTTPAANATIEGTVTVGASATAAPEDDVDEIEFYDGVKSIGTIYCQGQTVCSGTIRWDTTGLSGIHSLSAVATQSGEEQATSSPVSVTILSPPPTVTITSPTGGSTVKGNVAVSVSGATDPSQSDYPTSIVVYDGVNEVGTIHCQEQQTCQGSVTWHATGLSGPHSLSAKLSTDNGLSVRSASVPVTVLSPAPTVAITSPAAGAHLGGTLLIRVSGQTDPSQVDYPTSIAVFDGSSQIGSINCQGQQICLGSVSWDTKGLTGPHTLAAVIHTEAGRTATSKHLIVGTSSHPAPHAKGRASGSCQLPLAVPVRHTDRGVCVLHGVPRGTGVTVQYRNSAGGWNSAVRGHVGRGGVFRFHLRDRRPAVYELTLLVKSNRVSAATRLPIGTLHIG